MSETQLVCDICNKTIPFGAAFVSINYNIENFENDPITLNTFINVITSDQTLTMCGKCANRRNANKVQSILKTTLKLKEPRLN